MAVDNANKKRQKSLVSFAISAALLSMASTSTVQAAPLVPTPSLASSAANGGADATEVSVLKRLETLASATDNAELKALLALADTDAKAAQLAGELTPDRSGASVYNVILAQDLFTQSIRKRTSDFLLGDSARSSLWVSALGSDNTSYVTSDGLNRYDGFDSTSTGIVVGYEQVLAAGRILGVAFSQQNIDSENRLYDNSLEIESYQASIYGTQAWRNYYLSGRGVLGWNSNTNKRKIGDDYAQGLYNSFNTALGFDLVRPFYWQNLSILPTVSANYTHVKVEDYAEHYIREYDKAGEKLVKSAGSPASLAYEQQDYQELTFGFGLELAHSLYTKLGAFQTRAGMKANAEVLDMDLTSTASFIAGGDSFTVGVNEREAMRYESYLDLSLETNGSMTWSLGVQHNWDDTRESNMFYGRAVYSF